jgi:hypothetical protein
LQIILRLKIVQGTSHSVLQVVSLSYKKSTKFGKLAKFAKKGFLGYLSLPIVGLVVGFVVGRVVGTDMNYTIVKLAKKSSGNGQKALKPILELISRFFQF